MQDAAARDTSQFDTVATWARGIAVHPLVERLAACFPEFHFYVRAAQQVDVTVKPDLESDVVLGTETHFVYDIFKEPTGLPSYFHFDGEYGSKFLRAHAIVADTLYLEERIDFLEAVARGYAEDARSGRYFEKPGWPVTRDKSMRYEMPLFEWHALSEFEQVRRIEQFKLHDQLVPWSVFEPASAVTDFGADLFASQHGLKILHDYHPEVVQSFMRTREVFEAAATTSIPVDNKFSLYNAHVDATRNAIVALVELAHVEDGPWLGQTNGFLVPFGRGISARTIAAICELSEAQTGELVKDLATQGRVLLTASESMILPRSWRPVPDLVVPGGDGIAAIPDASGLRCYFSERSVPFVVDAIPELVEVLEREAHLAALIQQLEAIFRLELPTDTPDGFGPELGLEQRRLNDESGEQ